MTSDSDPIAIGGLLVLLLVVGVILIWPRRK